MLTFLRCAAVLALFACLFAQEALRPASPAPAPVASKPASPPDSTRLVLREAKRPEYPDYARANKIQGQVILRLFVGEQGEVFKTEVLSGDEIFVDVCRKAAMKFRFEPFIRSGVPAKVSTKFPFDFYIEGNASEVRLPDDPAEASQKPIELAQGVTTGLLIHKVQPAYPPAAKWNHIEGSVVMQAIIGKDGLIKDLKAISGPPELRQAALGAVQQWRYKPYVLNGEPVEVATHVTVNFTLSW